MSRVKLPAGQERKMISIRLSPETISNLRSLSRRYSKTKTSIIEHALKKFDLLPPPL